MNNSFNPREYWEKRLRSSFDLQGTGHHRFDLEYNKWLYHAQRDCMDDLVNKYKFTVSGKRIIDIGSGTGFYLEYYQSYQPASLTGMDITQCSIEYLKKKFPEGHFIQHDISDQFLPPKDAFDIISAMGVLYHIIDDNKFTQAVTNLCDMLVPEGYLLISDAFNEPFFPSARHAHFRGLKSYQPILEAHQIKIIHTIPLYYFLNRSFIPFIGSRIIKTFRLGKPLYHLDRILRSFALSNFGNLKILLAQKFYGEIGGNKRG